MLLSLVLCFSCVSGLAAEAGVTLISGPEAETEPVSLDDMQLNVEAEIDGYGILRLREFAFSDRLGYYTAGSNNGRKYYETGLEADYALLWVDLLNIGTNPRDYLSSCEVKVVFDDKYEYAGFFYQSNYNNKTDTDSYYGEDSGKQNQRFAIDKADQFAIDPMYEGHYIFGCTLPNAVVSSKAPLRMEILLDGNEITYNIRK
jgi:hypothetical protein